VAYCFGVTPTLVAEGRCQAGLGETSCSRRPEIATRAFPAARSDQRSQAMAGSATDECAHAFPRPLHRPAQAILARQCAMAAVDQLLGSPAAKILQIDVIPLISERACREEHRAPAGYSTVPRGREEMRQCASTTDGPESNPAKQAVEQAPRPLSLDHAIRLAEVDDELEHPVGESSARAKRSSLPSKYQKDFDQARQMRGAPPALRPAAEGRGDLLSDDAHGDDWYARRCQKKRDIQGYLHYCWNANLPVG